jgi:vitamin B12 transporter
MPLCVGAASLAVLVPNATAANAQGADEVVVTATRVATPIEQVGSSVTVIDRQQIDERQYRSVVDALESVPGLRIVQQGTRGTIASVFMRGTNSNQTLVLLNGKRISDPSSPTGAFNFAHIQLENVERIEVVRGPQSSLYGSDAIGGVINVITRKGEGDAFSGRALVEVGTLETLNAQAGANGRQAGFGYDLSLSAYETEGDTVTPARLRPAGVAEENDGYRNVTGSARFDMALTDHISLDLFGQAVDTESELDLAPEDPDSQEETRQYFASADLSGEFFDGVFRPILSLSYSEYTRDDSNRPDSRSLTFQDTKQEGDRIYAGLRNEIDVDENNTLIVGGEFYDEGFESSGFTRFVFFGLTTVIRQASDASAYTAAGYVQDQFTYGNLSGTAGVRVDSPEDFDEEVTWHFAPSYRVPSWGTRFKGSIGTGFKTPSLFERFGFNPTESPFGNTVYRGNPDLDPEESFGWEVGFEQELLDGRVSFGSTYFQSDVENAVVTVFDASFNSTTSNNTDLDIYGIESFVEGAVNEALSLRADHTFLRAEDESTGLQVVRRPKHKLSVDARLRIAANARLTGGVVLLSGINDIDFTTGGTTGLPGYAIFRMAGELDINERFSVTARVENLTDRDYEIANGFKGPGLEAFLGGRFTF